jgi:hypothetical protein
VTEYQIIGKSPKFGTSLRQEKWCLLLVTPWLDSLVTRVDGVKIPNSSVIYPGSSAPKYFASFFEFFLPDPTPSLAADSQSSSRLTTDFTFTFSLSHFFPPSCVAIV